MSRSYRHRMFPFNLYGLTALPPGTAFNPGKATVLVEWPIPVHPLKRKRRE